MNTIKIASLLQCLGRFESEPISTRIKTNEKRVSIIWRTYLKVLIKCRPEVQFSSDFDLNLNMLLVPCCKI